MSLGTIVGGDKWVSVDDALPQNKGPLLMKVRNYGIEQGVWWGEGFSLNGTEAQGLECDVTHWKRMPPKPRKTLLKKWGNK